MAPVLNGRYTLVCCVATLLSFFTHELAHWVTGTALGYNMVLTLNAVFPLSGEYRLPEHYTIVSAAGPLFTMGQAIVFWQILRGNGNPMLYPFLLTALYIRVLAAVMSIFNPNDEARISKALGIGTWTLPILVCVLLLYMVADVTKRKH